MYVFEIYILISKHVCGFYMFLVFKLFSYSVLFVCDFRSMVLTQHKYCKVRHAETQTRQVRQGKV